MHAVFAPEIAVGVFPFNHNGGGFHSSFVSLLIVHDLIGEAMTFGPAGVHAVKHLGPVLGFRSAGIGMEGQNSVGGVVLPGEQGLQFGGFHALDQGVVLLFQFRQERFIFLFIAHFTQNHHVLPGGTALFLGFQLVFQLFQFLENPLGVLGVIPKSVRGALCL